MARGYSLDLRERAVAHVESRLTRRAAAVFKVRMANMTGRGNFRCRSGGAP